MAGTTRELTADWPKQPHRRYNPLLDEWVLVSPRRGDRPWSGRQEPVAPRELPPYDPACYLCPGNRRASGEVNPAYTDTFVFTNDFPALLPDAAPAPRPPHPLLRVETEAGTCRVACFSPRHDLTLPELELQQVRAVVQTWVDQSAELGQRFPWVQVFENKGELMGCSNPHPHCQVWASSQLPNNPSQEDLAQRDYLARHGVPLLEDYVQLEATSGERTVVANDHWLAVVPFWAVWPFEVLLLPRRAIQRLTEVSEDEKSALAAILRQVLTRYDNLFETSFPYSMGWHGAPYDGLDQPHWRLHAHFFPPLLRSATVKKFMVGYELLAEAQRDLTAEQAAERLRSLSDIHYRRR